MKHRSWRKSVYQSTSHFAVVLLLLILFISAAYFFFVPESSVPTEQDELMAELGANKELWEENRPSAFRYVVDRNCYCGPRYTKPYIATEQLGHRSAAYPSYDPLQSADLAAAPLDPDWIDDLFGVIADAILDSGLVEAAYDTRFGFPNKIIISYPVPDGGQQIYVRDFEVITYD